MSTWTSRTATRAIAAVACLALAGCGGGGFRIGGAGGGREPAPQQVAVTSDQVVVAGPEGYCVDPTATRDRGDTGFVLLGNCAAIANSRRAVQPDTPALLTAAISAPSEGGSLAANMGELDGFFRSGEGLALLSRNGEAASVTILDSAAEGDVFFLHALDRSESPIDGVQDEYWRAYMDVGNRIATLSVLALEDREMSEAESLGTLRAFTAAVRGANTAAPTGPAPVPPPVTTVQPVAPAPSGPQTLPLGQGPLWNVGAVSSDIRVRTTAGC